MTPTELMIAGGIAVVVITMICHLLIQKKWLGSGYQLKPSLLTKAELNFWMALKPAIPKNLHATIKPRLADIFDVARTSQRNKQNGAFWKISAKHVDFLLIDINTGKPVIGIELDDSSHNRKDRINRDEFVNALFHKSGLPLLRIPVKKSYSNVELKQQIAECIK